MTLTYFTVNGTQFGGVADPRDPGQYPVMVANNLAMNPWQVVADQLDGLRATPLLNWIPTPYPAAVYPMAASVTKGVQVLGNNIASCPVGTPKALGGYSQGAVVTSTVWRDHILNPAGELHAYENDFVAALTWGNPMRAPGVCNGNTYAGWANPGGGGIAGTDDLTTDETPSWWFDFANPNDLYTDSPVGTAAGADEQLVYQLIMTQSFGGTLIGLLALIRSAIMQFSQPLTEIIGIATAIWNGLVFLSAGPNAGHYQYSVVPAITYMYQTAVAYE